MANSKSVGVAFSDPALDGGTIDNTVIGGTTKAAISCTTLTATGAATLAAISGTTLTATGNTAIGTSAANTLGFYGTTPATQRAAAIQAASVVSAASYISVSTNLCVFAAEVAATLTALGLWKGEA
jgi:hypothetical protein